MKEKVTTNSPSLIHLLPPHTIQLIAAGEVIEKPVSALKELLENSIDAGATQIKIRLGGGGLHLLSVEDNGSGISELSLPFLFHKHATSKMKTFEDLESLESYGFRGEALHSLGVMGEVTVWTSTEGASLGQRITMRFGAMDGVEKAEKRRGTEVVVRNLFGQTPARRKFLKSERSEKRALSDLARKMASYFYKIDWTLEDAEDGIRWMRRAESRGLRLAWAFDSESQDDWAFCETEGAWGRAEIDYVKPSSIGRSKAGSLVFINQRLVKESSIEFAVRKGFESFTDRPREISSIVRLSIPPHLVDPNIHPRKLEVALIPRDEIISAIIHTMREHLSEDHRRHWSEDHRGNLSEDSQRNESESVMAREVVSSVFSHSPQKNLSFGVSRSASSEATLEETPGSQPIAAFAAQTNMALAPQTVTAAVSPLNLDDFTVWGEIDQTFLVVKRGADLLLFDQHALHERILYEDLNRQIHERRRIPSQRKLFPETLKIDGLETLLDSEDLLESLGYEIRAWQGDSLHLVAAPAVVKRGHAEILSALVQSKDLPREVVFKGLLETMACHSAVRAHDFLSPEEAKRIVRQFFALPNVGYCPHGRPTFVRLSVHDLEKLFHRVR